MKNTRLNRLAATGAATALAAAALVGGGTTTAHAVSGTANYVCGPLGAIPVSVDAPVFDHELIARTEAGGVEEIGVDALLPGEALGLLGMLGVSEIGATLTDFHLWLGEGGQEISNLSIPTTALPAGGELPLAGTGVLSSLVTPNDAGTYPLSLPSSFTMVPAANVPLPIESLDCTLAEGSDPVIGQVEVVKSGSSITGKTAETKKGHKAVAKVSRSVGGDVFGKVVAKLGKKTVGSKAVNRKGKAVFALPSSAHGKKLTLIYKGDSGTEGSRTSLKVK